MNISWLTDIKEKWLPKGQKAYTVMDAYTITKYGKRMTLDNLCMECANEIYLLIQAKSARNAYSLVFDLDENIPELGKFLEDYYIKLGFNCLILDSSVNEKIETPQLYISWRNKK